MTSLQARWDRAIREAGGSLERAGEYYDGIVAAYTEEGRHYHTLDHIVSLLRAIDRHDGDLADRAAVELAAWYHDVVYDTRRNDNEERSADRAAAELHLLGVRDETIDRVVALILMTKEHLPPPDDSDAALFLDADLAILGAPEAEYRAYADAIRREYARVPEPDYRRGRRHMLERLLRRDRIFTTARLGSMLEERARRNMERELESLSSD